MHAGFIKAYRNLPHLLRESWNAAPSLWTIVFVLRALLGCLPIAVLAVTGLLFDEILAAQNSHTFTRTLGWLLVGEAGLTLLIAGLSRLVIHYDSVLINHFSLRMNLQLIAHCNALDLETFENAEFQDRLQRAKEQVATQVALLRTLLLTIQQLVSVVSLFVSCFLLAPLLVAVQLLGIVPLVLWESYYVRLRYATSWERTPVRRLLDYLQSLVVHVSTVKEMKLFQAGQYVYDRYRSVSSSHNLEDDRHSWRAAMAAVWLGATATLLYYLAYRLLIQRAVNGSLKIGQLIFFAGLLYRFSSQLLILSATLFQGFDQLLYITDLLNFFSFKAKVVDRGRGAPIPDEILHGIEFKNVSYCYANSDCAALNDVSFLVRPGETIALVGENGAGKTTVAKLIARFYDPLRGQILLDGRDLRDYPIESLRGITTALFQDFVKYDLSAKLNIGIGDVAALNDDLRISLAADEAGASQFIKKFPNGYDQPLGRRFANGTDLSGGQWQRLALARAYLRRAKIVILDEPTGALDPRSEAILFADLTKMAHDKITIVITHRLSTVRFADRILVLKNGSVCEMGKHDELIKLGGEYADLFALQARGYS